MLVCSLFLYVQQGFIPCTMDKISTLDITYSRCLNCFLKMSSLLGNTVLHNWNLVVLMEISMKKSIVKVNDARKSCP